MVFWWFKETFWWFKVPFWRFKVPFWDLRDRFVEDYFFQTCFLTVSHLFVVFYCLFVYSLGIFHCNFGVNQIVAFHFSLPTNFDTVPQWNENECDEAGFLFAFAFIFLFHLNPVLYEGISHLSSFFIWVVERLLKYLGNLNWAFVSLFFIRYWPGHWKISEGSFASVTEPDELFFYLNIIELSL